MGDGEDTVVPKDFGVELGLCTPAKQSTYLPLHRAGGESRHEFALQEQE
jgi:hypothetical protein